MDALSKKLRGGEGMIAHWCPGCSCSHVIFTASPGGPEWQWDGNVDAPTVSPSVRLFWPAMADRPEVTRCHYFLRAGQIAYCADSAHELAGKTVPLPDFPDDWGVK